MNSGKSISLKEILWRVKLHPLMSDLTYDDAALYAIEAIRLIGAPVSFSRNIKELSVVNHKARLPESLIEIRGIKDFYSNVAYSYASDIYMGDNCNEDFNCECIKDSNFSYTYEQGILKTSIKNTKVLLSYKSLPVDEEGYPLINDNQANQNAIRYHILYSHLEPLYDIGKVTDKAFNRISQNRDWYIGAASSSMQLNNLDHLETTMNAINRLLINTTAHSQGFSTLSFK